MNIIAAITLADELCWLCVQGAKGINATITLAEAASQAQEEVLRHLKPHATSSTTEPDGTVILQFEDGVLRGKGLYWYEDSPALRAHRKRLAKAIQAAMFGAEESVPGDAQHAQAEVEFCLNDLDGKLMHADNGKVQYNIVLGNGTSLDISGHGITWWFGQLYQEGYGEAISPQRQPAIA